MIRLTILAVSSVLALGIVAVQAQPVPVVPAPVYHDHDWRAHEHERTVRHEEQHLKAEQRDIEAHRKALRAQRHLDEENGFYGR